MPITKLQSFEFPAGAAAKYDWDAILSGEIVFLAEGKDYDRQREAFKTTIRLKANARGLGVHLVNIDAGSDLAKKYKLKVAGLVVQAYPGTPEQVDEWNKQAAARKLATKAKAKAKREAAKTKAPVTTTPAATGSDGAAA